MKRTFFFYSIAFLILFSNLKAQTTLSGELKQWHRVTLTFESGFTLSETSVPNPFTDYRLNVTFTKGAKTYVVPGYFAGDGNAANTAGTSGSKWRVHFSPDETGVWTYSVSFRTGSYIAVSDEVIIGNTVAPLNGVAGSFTVQASNKTGNDFRAKGRLKYVGKHHLQFAGSGKYYVKGGSYCPENFLAYYQFDGTYDAGGVSATTLPNGLHQYPDHLQDWHTGDPTWQNGKGKSIVGALNYLASNGMNALGFIVMNQKGDGDDTWPYISHNVADRERFDLSKLDQWEIIFNHMDSLGLAQHIVLSERENQMILDNGDLGTQRRLFYRELIARFSHHLGIMWDLGEENGREFLSRGFQSDQQRKDMATYFKTHDPYKSFVCLNAFDNTAIYRPLLGYPDFDGTSQQDYYQGVHNFTVQWRDSSALKGRKWVIFHDETRGGITVDGANNNHFQMRKSVLWGNLMGGGGGVEWYFGNDDINVESFRTRANVWSFTRHALTFFNYLPFEEMKNMNSITSSTTDYCLGLPGKVYAIYIPNSSSTNITLPCGSYTVKWFDPKNGGTLLNGSVTTVGSGTVSIGTPPYANEDWAVLLTNNFSIAFDVINTGSCTSTQAQVRANPLNGPAPFTFLWSNGATGQTVQGLTPGNYTVTVTGANGCSTSAQVTISSQVQGTVTNVAVSICSGKQHFAGGAWRAQSGIYYDTLSGAGNCDSIVITTLTVRPPITKNRSVATCQGTPVFLGGAWRSQSGTYYDNFTTPAGCDSIVATALTVHPNVTKNVAVMICTGQQYFAGGAWRTTPGFYRDTLNSAAGCDSIVVTALGVTNIKTSQRQLNLCTGDSVLLGGKFRKQSGTYYDTLNTTAGCDSVVTTQLTVAFCNPCTVYDCNGVCNGAATIDQCGICVGGNTGRTACTDCALRVNSLTLMYEGTLGPVTTMTNNMVINKDTLCRFNIRANVCQQSTVGSVKFILNGSTFRNETTAPYSIYGDNNGSYNAWMPAAGSYTLKVVPYTGTGGTGTPGTFITINFTVVNPSGGTPAACTATPARDCNGTINGTAFLDGCGVCSGGTTGHVANSDKDNCGVCFGNNSTCCTTAAQCNDNNACTTNNCVSGQCVYTSIVCNDNNGCTNDGCANGVCQFTPKVCNDNLACTNDACVSNQCQYTPIAGQSCCTTATQCNDNNACTADVCTNGQCTNPPVASQPPYLKVVNPERSWRKLKFGYSPTNIWSPKLDVTATGNHTLCITLRVPAGTTPEWSKIQVRPQASAANAVALGSFLPPGGVGSDWATICIPLAAFNGFNFTQISYFEFPFSNGANAFELHIKKVEFIGGTTPFLFFGDTKTDNYHDGAVGNPSSLIAQLMPGQSCSTKMEEEADLNIESTETFVNAFPNPFSEKLNIEFMLAEDENVRLEVYNLTGQLLATVFAGDVRANEWIHTEFTADIPSGMVFYRLQGAKTVKIGKVLVER